MRLFKDIFLFLLGMIIWFIIDLYFISGESGFIGDSCISDSKGGRLEGTIEISLFSFNLLNDSMYKERKYFPS